ncbi:MAG: DUF3108 domain-containing protein [Pseudomonadota bacterium]|nr:DUF3108 domain-containing protein [Pseudomonadota bacterium]
MRSETPPILPRGRPSTRVLLALTVTAVALHGCLLDGVPLDATDLPLLPTIPGAPSVQVRSVPVAVPPAPPESSRVAPVSTPVALIKATSARTARPAAARIDAPSMSPVFQVAAVESYRTAAPVSEPPAPAASTAAGEIETPLAAEPVPGASAAENHPAAHAGASAPTEAVPLRQPEHAVPVYRTKIPPAATLEYDIRRGSIAGTGELMWRPDGSRYEARLQASVIGFTLLAQVSQGGFDKAGLAPLRFTDQRARKAARAANFQRDAGKITFSGPRDEFALPAGAQDRLSWMIQLPAVLLAEPKRAVQGGEVVLYVAGARADVDLWNLRCIGVETVETAAGPVRTVKFMRTPRGPKDTLAEVWLDPLRHYLPVRARLTHGGDDEDAFELVLRDLKTAP